MKVARNAKGTVPSLDVQSIHDISKRAFWDGLEILAVIELLKSGNRRRVQESFNKSGTRFAADIIKARAPHFLGHKKSRWKSSLARRSRRAGRVRAFKKKSRHCWQDAKPH